jgi:transcriptional regulator with PAS, ATPase and Fis domain
MQVKLLRVLQEKRVLRLGGKQTRQVDFRLIAATNRNMRDMVERGEFREDLFFRLDVLPVRVPPLRERAEDIPLLTLHYLEKFKKETGKSFRMTTELLESMGKYHWPGNVRELINMLWYGVTFSTTEVLTLENLADRFHRPQERREPTCSAAARPGGSSPGVGGEAAAGGERARRRNARLLEKRTLYFDTLSRYADTTEGKRAAAKELGVSLATLYRILHTGAP